MSEKRWTDDERSEAFERGLKTMEGVALELYRRGREPLLEELEEARARNADMRAMLEQVTRERDEARAELAALRKRVVEALPYPTDDDSDESRTAEEAIEMAVAERDSAYRSRDLAIKMWDEARAEVERLRAEADRWKRSCNVFRERDWPKAFQATVTSLEQEVSDAHEQLAKLRKLSKPWEGGAYQRGAEAMREACAQWVDHWASEVLAEKMRALPIPRSHEA